MFSVIIKMSLMSIITIFLVHHLIYFLKSTLTVPKIKDLVNLPNQKYKDIFDTITSNHNDNHNDYDNASNYTSIDLLPPVTNENNDPSNMKNDPSNMKNELKDFLKKQMNINDITPIDTSNNFVSI